MTHDCRQNPPNFATGSLHKRKQEKALERTGCEGQVNILPSSAKYTNLNKHGQVRVSELKWVNKITDVTTIISNSGKQFHLFGVSESRLTDQMPSSGFLTPDCTAVRTDVKTNSKTGVYIYIRDTISHKHPSHLDQPGVEAVWLEISITKSNSNLGWFLLQKSGFTCWLDGRLTEMMDRVSFESNETIPLGNFNIDL